MKPIFISVAAATLLQAGCIEVPSSEIVAGNLADSVLAFRVLDPATPVGFAPLPGMQRILTARQLNDILRREGVSDMAEMHDICVERLTRPLSSELLRAALLSALGLSDANLDIIDYSKAPLPPGDLQFDRNDLNRPPEASPNAPVIWRGKLLYDARRSASIWAKVQIWVDTPRLITTTNIRAGATIGPDQVRLVEERHFPDWIPPLTSAEAAIGKIARRPIGMRQPLVPALIEDRPDIQKGDKVHVKAVEGGATLALDAFAQSAGKMGDIILIHNPVSGRDFRAVVTARDEVLVRPGGF